MSDFELVLVLVASCAMFVTAHVTIALGLLWRPRRWRAPVAIVAIPMAVYWAIREKMWIRAGAWVTAAAAYGAVRIIGG